MTLDHLYALYRHAYREFDHAGADRGARVLPLPPVARAVAEFAESDAHDGRPLRSFSEFRLALSLGADALAPLGWRAA
jgi:hypothetical protein